MEKEFRFSPRDNRAGEIRWRRWGKEAFDEARERNRLVLLSLSAVWCHWCHVMDETSYSDSEAIELINRELVPIRVDTDRRPDVNDRYNLGGWPTTAILNSEGELITGGTYIPPERFVPWLRQILRLHRNDPEGFRNARRQRELQPPKGQPGDVPDPGKADRILGATVDAYDHRHGGFGSAPKFPLTDAIELFLFHGCSGQPDLLDKAAYTLERMATGGLYDHEEGGFFRYSTTRSWSIPHFEKMLDDNSALLFLLAAVYTVTGEAFFAEKALQTINYLKETLWMEEEGLWAGSQDADEEYYALSLPEREKRPPPYVDRTAYSGPNSILARSLCLAGSYLDRPELLDLGSTTLANLAKAAWDPERGLRRYTGAPGESPRGLLSDTAAFGQALNTLYAFTGERACLDLGRQVVAWAGKNLSRDGGGYYDLVPDPRETGPLARPRLDVLENASMARFLAEYSVLSGDEEALRSAALALLALEDEAVRYGYHGAAHALAVREVLSDWTRIEVTAGGEKGRALFRAAAGRYRPLTLAVAAGESTDPLKAKPAAYICRGRTCSPPLERPEELDQMLEAQVEKA